MNKAFKKWTTVVLAVVLTVAFMPAGFGALGVDAPGVDKAYADNPEQTETENSELNGYITGLSSGKAQTGSTLSLSLEPYSVIYHFIGADPGAYLQWELWNGSTVESTKKITDSDKTFTVPDLAGGKSVRLCIVSSESNKIRSTAIKIPLIINIKSGPSITGLRYDSLSLLKKNMTVDLSGYGAYNTNANSSYKYQDTKIIKLYSNGKYFGTKSTDGSSIVFHNVPVKYNANNAIKVEIYMNLEGNTISGGSKTYTVPGGKLGKNTVRATKISKKKVIVKWSGVAGASGYYLYMGKKKIKTLSASKRKYTVNKKNAYKYRYKVVPYIKAGTKKYKGTSSAPKPKKNQLKLNRSTNYGSASYSTCPFRITKISLKGNVYTITGYAVNNRIYPMKKYKNFKLALYIDGKKAFSKKWSSKKINVKESSSKKIVIKVRGRAGVDLANYNTISYTEGGTPVWMWHGKVMKPL